MSLWGWARKRPAIQRRAGEDLLRSLALIIEPDTLRASIAERVRELTASESVVICSVRSSDAAFAAVCRSLLDESLTDVAFAPNGTLVRWLQANQEPFLVADRRGTFGYLDESEQAMFRAHSICACVPIFSGARLMAMLLIRSAKTDWRLSEDDVALLIRLGRQAGLAIENAELHQLERERLKNLHQAQQLAVAGQLAATVAHEIRNPLTAVRSTVQYVVHSATEWEKKRELLEGILEEVDRIERTVGGMLALSRPQELELQEIDLIASVEQSLLLVQAYAQANGITLNRQFEVDALPVRGDARGLHQVCVNLVLNGCQAMPKGGRLTLRCGVWQPTRDARPVASLQISDTGCGIKEDDLARAFDPFFTTKKTGSGLGLPICLDIVTRHGGNLRLESVEGRGTTATVLLPLRTN